mmetsp:Transcript_50375/g.135123  ORF Transcript_50375/g.135123 Transcript_50375/m.135123 type:complete len:281 (-) Transcript_50375:396-1238(-)
MPPSIPVGERHGDDVSYPFLLLWLLCGSPSSVEARAVDTDAHGRLPVVPLRQKSQVAALEPLRIVAEIAEVVGILSGHVAVSLESADRIPSSTAVEASLQLIFSDPLLPTCDVRFHNLPSFARAPRSMSRLPQAQQRWRRICFRWRVSTCSAHVCDIASATQVHLQVRLMTILDPTIQKLFTAAVVGVPHRHVPWSNPAFSEGRRLLLRQLRAAVPTELRPLQQGLLDDPFGGSRGQCHEGLRHLVRRRPHRWHEQLGPVFLLLHIRTATDANHGQLKGP